MQSLGGQRESLGEHPYVDVVHLFSSWWHSQVTGIGTAGTLAGHVPAQARPSLYATGLVAYNYDSTII